MPPLDKKTAASDSPSALIRNAPLLFILLLALGLRLWGIGWGLPNATRLFSYHPDESLVAGEASYTDGSGCGRGRARGLGRGGAR